MVPLCVFVCNLDRCTYANKMLEGEAVFWFRQSIEVISGMRTRVELRHFMRLSCPFYSLSSVDIWV